MKREQKLLVKFAVLLTILFFSHAISFSLLIPYLEGLGFDAAARGWVFTIGAFATIVGQFLFGYLCDKFKTDKWMFFLSAIIFAVSVWFVYSVNNDSVLLLILWITLLFSLFRIVQGVLDSWVIESDKYCLDNYGWIRVFGSIGWAIGSPATAYFMTKWGYASLGTIFVILTVLTLVVAYFIEDAHKVEVSKKITLADTKELLFDKNFMILTIVFLFLFIANTADMYATIDKMLAIGTDAGVISLKWSFQALCELPLFFLGGWLVKKFGGVKIVAFATVMYIIRFILSGLATTPMQLVWISSFQMVTFPLIMICTKQMIDEVSPPFLRASAQQISSGIYMGGSLLLTPLYCGIVGKYFSSDVALFGVSALSIIPLLLLMYYQAHNKKSA